MYGILAFVAEVIGFWLYGRPLAIEELMPASVVFGAFLVFLYWLYGLYAWGTLLAKWLKIKAHPGNCLCLGSLALSLGLFPFSAVGVLRFEYYQIYIFLLAAPIALNFYLACKNSDSWQEQKIPFFSSLGARLATLGILVCLSFVGLLSFYPDTFPDPLSYHLTAARVWAEQGSFARPDFMPSLYGASYWEQLFTWGQILLGEDPGAGLVAGQLFAQWTNVAVAGVGSAFLLYRLFAHLFPGQREVYWLLATLSALCTNSLLPMLQIAKNDWGAIFWMISSLVFALESRRFFLAGLCAGMAALAKLSAAPLAILFLLYLWWNAERKYLGALAAGFFLGALPIFLRNAWGTGNPFFPAFNAFFPSPLLGPTWLNMQDYEGRWLQTNIATLWQRLKDPFYENPFCSLLLALPFLARGNRTVFGLSMLLSISYVLFSLKVGARTEPRLFGVGFVIASGLGLLLIVPYAQRFQIKSITFLILTFTLIGCFVRLPIFAPAVIANMQSPSLEILKHDSSAALLWLRRFLKPGERVVSASEGRLYYMLPWRMVRIWDDAALDKACSQAASPTQLFTSLQEQRVTHVLITHSLLDTYYDEKVWTWINEVSKKFPESLVFSSPTSRVINVSKAVETLKANGLDRDVKTLPSHQSK